MPHRFLERVVLGENRVRVAGHQHLAVSVRALEQADGTTVLDRDHLALFIHRLAVRKLDQLHLGAQGLKRLKDQRFHGRKAFEVPAAAVHA